MRGATYWQRLRRMTGVLLIIWFLVSFGLTFFARELSFLFMGWPFSFWVAAQGALLVYLALIAFYAWYANRLDRQYGLQDPPPASEPEES